MRGSLALATTESRWLSVLKAFSDVKKILNLTENITQKYFYLILIAFSSVLAARIQYIQHGWINPDTVLYFESARLIALGHFKEATQIFNWPLYSLCISTVHKTTSLSIHHSAQLLNVVFFAITVVSFTKIIELGGGNKRTLTAGVLILFSSLYIVGDVLEMLMRDQGFWACFLTGLVFFIRFKKNKRYQDAFAWYLFMVLATLFRIEAIMYLMLLPFLLLLETNFTWQERMAHFIKCNLLNITSIIAIGLMLSFNNQISIESLGRLQEIFTTQLINEMTLMFIEKSQIMSDQVLGEYLQEFAGIGLLLTFIYVMLIKTITTTGIINIILAFYSRLQKSLINPLVWEVLRTTAIIAVVIMALIIYKRFVLSSRYIVALAFVLMIPAAFQLGSLLTQYSQNKIKNKRLILTIYIVIAFMLGSIIKNIWPKAEGYNYMQDAVAWTKIINRNNAPVFYNESRMRYYADEKFIGTWPNNWDMIQQKINNGEIEQYNYLLISYSQKDTYKIDNIKSQLKNHVLTKKISDAKGKKGVLIFEKTKD